MAKSYTNGGSTLEFYINQYDQIYMEIEGKWISLPYDEAIKLGQELIDMGEELENKYNG